MTMANPLEEVKKLTIGQLAALVHAIGGLVAVKAILGDDGLAKKIADLVTEASWTDLNWRERWAQFYREVFNLEVDLSKVKLPAGKDGFVCVLVIAKELGDEPINKAIAACRVHFGGRVITNDHDDGEGFDDLDARFTVNDRDSRNGSYAILVRPGENADIENKRVRACDFAELNITTMTLLERVILELHNFFMFSRPFVGSRPFVKYRPLDGDGNSSTLCSGTRQPRSYCGVPICHWSEDHDLGDGIEKAFKISEVSVDDCWNDVLRARSVIVA